MYTSNPYYYMNYMGYYQEYDYTYPQTMSQNPGFNYYDTYNNGCGNSGFVFNNSNSSNNSSYNAVYEEGDEVNQLRKTFDFCNLVQTRKNPHRFTGKKNKQWASLFTCDRLQL